MLKNFYYIIIFQLIFKSFMAPEGIFMLNSVFEILEMVGVQSIELDEDFSIDDVDGKDGLNSPGPEL